MAGLAAAFLGSFLLFTIEIAAARALLPRFGGAAWVWTAAMSLYQGLLLAGYLWARWALARWGSVYAKGHLALFAAGALFFPLRFAAGDSGRPLLDLLLVLLGGLGLPFLVLATTSPVVQAALEKARGRESYEVYAWSNVGALAALAGYPLLIEGALALPRQLAAWQGLYMVYGLCLWLALRGGLPAPAPAASAAPPELLRWSLLALGPSAALVAASQLILLDFAAVPLLWILPLSLYLLSFVLNFKRVPWSARGLSWSVLAAMAVWLAAVVVTALYSADLPERYALLRRLWALNKLFFVNASLFLLCLIGHRALAESRPPGPGAPSFYAAVALGGWLGSAWIAWLMPWAARTVALPELDWALAGAATIAILLWNSSRGSGLPRWSVGAAAALVLGGGLFYARHSPAIVEGSVETRRNLYGFYRVSEAEGQRRFFHGNTLHGLESLDPSASGEPTLYYHRGSPFGEAFALLGAGWRRVGVLGLGSGVMAAYGRPDMEMDFYELDPDVIALARRRFGFLARSPARLRLIPGDGRLGLAAEAGRYDALVVDVFSGGAIPVHMLTREALALYGERLAPEGLLLVHVTNRFLDLRPVLAALAQESGWRGAWKREQRLPGESSERYSSSWIALSRRPEEIERLHGSGWSPLAAFAGRARPWTDDRADLWSALR